jgi:hypothetical protein
MPARDWLVRGPLVVATLILAAPLRGQTGDTGTMKHDAMKTGEMSHDAMAKDDKMMGHDMMGPHGMFSGGNGHQTTGSYMIAAADGKQWVKLGADFSLDNAPDAYVVLSPTDKGGDRKALNLGKLKSFKGAQAYEIPAGTDLAGFGKVIIYCRKYNVTLGIADLAAPGEMMHK